MAEDTRPGMGLGEQPRTATISQQFVGPIPPSGEFERYEAILPGSANRILAMAERSAAHRHQWEARVLDIDEAAVKGGIGLQARGQCFAFILGLIVLVLGGYLMATGGEPKWGFTIILLDVLVLAGIFITGKVTEHLERKDRDGPDSSE